MRSICCTSYKMNRLANLYLYRRIYRTNCVHVGMFASTLLRLHDAQYLDDIARWEWRADVPRRRAITACALDNVYRQRPLPHPTRSLSSRRFVPNRETDYGKMPRIIFYVSAKARGVVPTDYTLLTFVCRNTRCVCDGRLQSHYYRGWYITSATRYPSSLVVLLVTRDDRPVLTRYQTLSQSSKWRLIVKSISSKTTVAYTGLPSNVSREKNHN